MVYNTDQCVECGGVRVGKSSLCANCLIACNGKLQLEIERLEDVIKRDMENAGFLLERKNDKIKELKYQLRIRWKLLQKIFTEYQTLLRLYKQDGLKLDAVNRIFR